MLLDRQNSMSSLFAMGNEVAAGCDTGERKAIEKQLKGLMLRFDALTDGAQQRMLDLEQAMKVNYFYFLLYKLTSCTVSDRSVVVIIYNGLYVHLICRYFTDCEQTQLPRLFN